MSPSKPKYRVFYGWYVLAASFFILFLNGGSRLTIGIMVKPMEADLHWSRGAISAAIFLNLAVYAVSTIFAGRLYDRYGPKWIIAGATLLFSAGYALMAVMDTPGEFYFYYGVLNAAGLAGTTIALFGSLIGRWFERWRGLAVSLALAGSCLGQFFLVPLFSDLISLSGWRITSLWIAGLSVLINTGLTFGVIRGDPAKLGLQPYGRHDRPKTGGEATLPPETASVSALPHDLTLTQAMRSRSLWLFTAAMLVCGSADFLVMTHLVPMVTDYGFSQGAAANMLAWLGLLSLPGILIAGPAADAIGNKLPIVITFALRVVLFVMVLLVKGSIPFWVFSLGFGFTMLVTAPLTWTLLGTLYGVTHIGFISGFVNTVHTVGGGLGAYLAGVAFDRTGDYDLAFVVSAVMAGVAVLCSLLIRERRHLPPACVGADASRG
jgi:MFS family permease